MPSVLPAAASSYHVQPPGPRIRGDLLLAPARDSTALVGFADICRALLVAAPEAVGGATAVMMAARGGHAEVLRVLLRHRADPSAADGSGATALHKVALYGPTEAVEALLGALGAAAADAGLVS